jgi:hypothetical protein
MISKGTYFHSYQMPLGLGSFVGICVSHTLQSYNRVGNKCKAIANNKCRVMARNRCKEIAWINSLVVTRNKCILLAQNEC